MHGRVQPTSDLGARPQTQTPMKYLVLLLLLARPAAAQRYNARLGPLPAGLAWQPLPAHKAAIPLPTGWHFQPETTAGATTYTLTPDELPESGEYATGLALHVVRRAAARLRHPALEYADLLMLRAGHGPGQQVLEQSGAAQGVFRTRSVRYRETPPGGGEVRLVYQLALANARTDTLYLLTFESPEADWPQAWPLGQAMVQGLTLDTRQ